MIIIPMCQLTKIFIPEQWNRLMKEPSLVHKKEEFAYSVSTSRRDYRFNFSAPKFETNPILLNWFLGGDDGFQTQETDWTGLVKLDMDNELNSTILGAVAGITSINSDAQILIEQAKEKAQALSLARVMRQIRAVNGNMMMQYERNKQDGKSLYTPSPVEFLCAYVLSEESAKSAEDKREITEKFQALLTKTFVN